MAGSLKNVMVCAAHVRIGKAEYRQATPWKSTE